MKFEIAFNYITPAELMYDLDVNHTPLEYTVVTAKDEKSVITAFFEQFDTLNPNHFRIHDIKRLPELNDSKDSNVEDPAVVYKNFSVIKYTTYMITHDDDIYSTRLHDYLFDENNIPWCRPYIIAEQTHVGDLNIIHGKNLESCEVELQVRKSFQEFVEEQQMNELKKKIGG